MPLPRDDLPISTPTTISVRRSRKVVCTLDNLLSTVMPAKVEINRIAARSAIAAWMQRRLMSALDEQ
ncbi:hypothetical protein PG988_000071 [Apiospora saccharicola]